MAIEQVSAVSQLDAYRRTAAAAYRSPEVSPEAPPPAEQSVAATVGTRVDVIPVPTDPAGSLERAGQEIERAYASGSPTPEEIRAAEEAYRVQAGARDELARQAQAEGARTLDITV